jgi:glycerol-3-phosphate O-acyltransferase
MGTSFPAHLKKCTEEGLIPEQISGVLENFYGSYLEAVTANGHAIEEYLPTLHAFLDRVVEILQHPPQFEPFHKMITSPFDYYHFGLDMLRPLVVFESSKVAHRERLQDMQAQLAQGHNVILLANHQTEPDPQAISLLLEKTHPRFAEEMIFVAGHRVISDPLAVPFSLGRNLLCIFSKKHIETPPEQKSEKLQHNQRTMKVLLQMLAEGGKCIYVAPSGGRDRPDGQGYVDVAPFDPQSIELFWLLAQQSGTPTHFYPLALYTYPLLPPPNSVEKELGEHRQAQCTPIRMAFGNEIDMDDFPGAGALPKKEKREARAIYIWEQVRSEYKNLIGQ